MNDSEKLSERNWRHLIEAVEEFGDGFTVIDRDLRLVLCNSRWIELLDLPAELGRPGTHFIEMMRYNAARGEYGEGDIETLANERVEKARKFVPHRFERTRPNGTIIEVRGTPLPSGGFVTIYSDITERRQTEEKIQRQSAYLQSVIASLPQGISVFDENLRLKYWNNQYRDGLEIPPEALYIDAAFEDLIMIPAKRGEYGPGDPVEHVRTRRELALKFQPHRFERSRPDGHTYLVEGCPMRMGEKLIGFVTAHTDITDRIAREQEVRRKNELLQTLFDNIPGGISLFDKDFKLVAYNDEYKRLLQLPDQLFVGEPTLERLYRFNAERGEYGNCNVEEKVKELLERAHERKAHKFERVRPDGTVLEIRGIPLADGGFVTIHADVTERKNAEAEINRLARFDYLTGLANRHSLESRLEQSLADSRRNKTKLAVMFLDLDHFKAINDSLGHAVGDALLVEISKRLVKCVRESDIVARLGGDEFVMVVGGLSDPKDVVKIASKVINSVAQPVMVGPHRLKTSASVGITIAPDDGQDWVALMKNADTAMYNAKNAGRSRYQFFSASMNAAS